MAFLFDLDSAHNPYLLRLAEERAKRLENRIADRITRFSGSMVFVYIHIAVFALWIIFKGHPLLDDPVPFGFLTMSVSLEAIFLGTFVLISQNRADARRQTIADHQWELTQVEWKENNELLTLQREVLELTRELHRLTGEVHEAVEAMRAEGRPGEARA